MPAAFLRQNGFAVDSEQEGHRGLSRAIAGGSDLSIPDVRLPVASTAGTLAAFRGKSFRVNLTGLGIRKAMKRGRAAYLCLLVATTGVAASESLPLARVDLNRMYGGWFLIATLPNRFEKGMIGPYDVYSRRPDGDIREDFYFRRGSFQSPRQHYVVHDWVRPGTNNAHWRVQLFWPVNLPFLVLYTDPDYRYVLFGEENRELGWIYSRTPTVPAQDYQDLLDRFKALGYNSSKFVKFVQTREQIGQPGFWSEGIR